MAKNLAGWLLVVAVVLVGCRHNALPDQPEIRPQVKGSQIIFPEDNDTLKALSTVAVLADTQRSLQIPGRLVWNEDQTVRIFSPFNGLVIDILVNTGQQVQTGQSLTAIQSPDFNVVQSEYYKAISDIAFAKKKLARQQELYQHGVSARKELEEAEANYANAEADLKRAQARLKPYGNPDKPTELFYLKSPLTGVVVQKAINPGQELAFGQDTGPLFIITNPSSLWAQLDAAEDDLANLSPNETFKIISHSYPKENFPGTITHISDYVDPVTRTVKVLAEVPNSERKLKAQMYITANFSLYAKPQLRVPSKAVILDKDNFYVFISKGNRTYIRTQIEVGAENQGMVPVLSGLNLEDKVVVEGAIYLNHLIQAARHQS
ncbi:efflux RND transporter periplasmic adaptor subunit [Candidatus Nitrosoglobus terrae]|nr:efflux RND transporter periplasmic adaptor subunit [Candidatus Nitrosoglobus terrae]